MLLLLGGVVAWAAIASSQALVWVLLNLALLAAFATLLVVPHELGHAFGAWLMGARLFRVYIGLGLSVFDGRRWGLRRERGPTEGLGGFVTAFQPETHRLRLRTFVFVLSGPLANALLLAVALWWLTPQGFLKGFLGWKEQLQPLQLFALANGTILLIALWPYRLKVWGGRLETDGLSLLTIPFRNPKKVRQQHAWYFLMEAQDCLHHKELEAARRWLAQLPADYLADPEVLHALASVLLSCRSFAEARQCWRDVLASPDLNSSMRMRARDAQATADLLLLLDDVRTTDGADLLEEVDALTQAALAEVRQLPELIPSFFGTRGGVLIEQRKYEEGEHLLRDVIEETGEAYIKAICTCYLALATARRGDGEAAGKHLETARALHPESFFLEGATRQVSRLQTRGAEVALG